MSAQQENEELKSILLENQRLLKENTVILKKMRTVALWDFGIRMLITAVFLGLPILAYYYVFEQYSGTFEKLFQTFEEYSQVQRLEGMLPRYDGE